MKIIVYLLLMIFFPLTSYSQVNVTFGLYIKDLRLDQRGGKFYSDLYWWVKIPKNIDSVLAKEYSKIEFVNGVNMSSEVLEEITTDNYYYTSGIYKGSFYFDPDFHDYPLDKQRIPIIVESYNQTNNLVNLVADTVSFKRKLPINRNLKNLDKNIHIPGFSLKFADYENELKEYQTTFGDPTLSQETKYSRLIFNIEIQRIRKSFVLKILIPNILLSIIAYLIFYIPPSKLDVAVGCTVTTLLASIALQFTINSSLPNVGYLTSADKLFYLFYFVITMALVQIVFINQIQSRGKHKMVSNLISIGRIGYPLTLLLGLLFILC